MKKYIVTIIFLLKLHFCIAASSFSTPSSQNSIASCCTDDERTSSISSDKKTIVPKQNVLKNIAGNAPTSYKEYLIRLNTPEDEIKKLTTLNKHVSDKKTRANTAGKYY